MAYPHRLNVITDLALTEKNKVANPHLKDFLIQNLFKQVILLIEIIYDISSFFSSSISYLL